MEIKTSYDGINSLRIDGNGISLGPAEETKIYGLNREPYTLTTTFTPQKSRNKLRTNPFRPYLLY